MVSRRAESIGGSSPLAAFGWLPREKIAVMKMARTIIHELIRIVKEQGETNKI